MQEISEAEGEKFARSCAEAGEYPVNLVYHNTYDHILKGYSGRLDEQEDRLFFDESKANLCLRDYDDGVKCFENVTLCNNDDLRDYLSGKPVLDRVDPQCRFVFLYAPHSRERLRTTRRMLLFIFTYHQVMPTFLDFLFPFGKQLYTQDFQFSGFRSEDRLSSDDRGLELPRLGRSGRDIRMCYNLKSVEPSKSQKEWPWSIRQTAAYHSFDIETGKAFWIIIKGDQLIKRRIESSTDARRAQALKLSEFDSLATSFSSTLQAHLLIFDWCHEHWRWYINFLEQELQRLTRETLLVDLGQSSNGIERTPSQGQRATSSRVYSSPLSVSEKATWRSGSEIKEPTSYPRPQHQAPPVPRPASSFAESQESLSADENFTFSDLQQVQSLEEKTNEIILVLDSNANTLSKVKQYYRDTFTFDEFPITLKSACARDFTKFEKAVGNIIGDLQMQESRTKMLLRLLTDRKSLLYGILDYRNMESNKLFASKAQLSTANMEIMTQDMHEIAQKTKQETVSMRIITLVTLFFLPGTFISTIMSTDIVQYQVSADGKSQEVFQLGALQLYLAITLPMMLLTFASWYGVYIWVDRKERAKAIQMHLRAES